MADKAIPAASIRTAGTANCGLLTMSLKFCVNPSIRVPPARLPLRCTPSPSAEVRGEDHDPSHCRLFQHPPHPRVQRFRAIVAQNKEPSIGDHHVPDRKSTRLNSSHLVISYAVFCLK